MTKLSVIYFYLLQFNFILGFNLGDNNLLTRRNLFTTTGSFLGLKSPVFSNNNNQDNTIDSDFSSSLFQLSPKFNNLPYNPDDPYAHWSFFGLSPPPIKESINYTQLVERIQQKEIFTIQIAPQHNSVIATTKQGYRLACSIPDKKFPQLQQDSLDQDRNQLVYVLPIDPIRQTIRSTFIISLESLSIYLLACEFDLIPNNLYFYNSIKERDEYIKNGTRPDRYLKNLGHRVFKRLNKKDD